MDSYEPGVEAEGSGEFGAEDQEAAWITRRTITAIALFVLLILLGGAVLVIAIGYIGAGYDGEDTRKDDLNRQTPVIPPAKYTDLVMTSPGPASYQSASNAEDLICTMGEDAELPETYPEDGLCDYLYYMNVWISSDTGKLTYSSQKSWEVFQEQMQARSITGGGISFNYLWFPYGSLSSNVTRTLEMLAAHNVKHYGFLDVIDSKPSSVGSLLFLGLQFVRKLKEIQGDDRTRKLIVAMGFYGHSVAADAWADYGDRFKHVVQSLPDVDIFITISSTAFSKHSLECTAFPPSVMTAFNDTYQSLERHAKMVNENFDLTKDATVVGFSLEMRTLTYELVDKAASIDDIAYKKCSARNFANASILCPPEPGMWKDLDTGTRAGFTNSSDRRTVFLGDTADTLAAKMTLRKTAEIDSREQGNEGETSEASGAEVQEAAWTTRPTITAIAVVALLILLSCVIVFIAISYTGAGYDDEDVTRKPSSPPAKSTDGVMTSPRPASNQSASNGYDDENVTRKPSSPPAKSTDRVMTSPRPASNQSASNGHLQGTSTSQALPTIKELICTVGDDAVRPEMYPEDGLCDYLYYMNVWISTKGVELFSTTSKKSWEVFQEQMRARSITGGGISLNYDFFPYGSFSSNVTRNLEMLAAHNVKHYGFLEAMEYRPIDVGSRFFKNREFLQKLKEIQGDDPTRKFIVALGFYGYSVADAWAKYRDRFKHIVQNLTEVDIFITISSTAYRKSNFECTAFPPSVMTALNDTYPSLERHANMVNSGFDFTKDDTIVGFSLEMGTRTYVLAKSVASTDEIAYKNCTTQDVADASILCPTGPGMWKDLDTATRAGFVNSGNWTAVFLGDTADTLAAKVNFVRGMFPNRRFPWLLSNVHFTDTGLKCFGSPFERVSRLKSLKTT